MRKPGGSPGVVEQPGATPGRQAYCPVSGVIFTVSAASPQRQAVGKTFFFCCMGCAGYFEINRERVLAARGVSLADGAS